MGQGYGQLTLYDTTSELGEVTFIIRQMLARMNTMKVVKVVAVNGAGGVAPAGTVDVQPLVSQIDGNNNAQPHGTIPGIQYFRLQGGANAVICDPVIGDVGYVIVSDRDFTNVKTSQSATVTPGSFRRNDLADGVYVGGILNQAPKQYIQFTDDGINIVFSSASQIQINSTGITLIGNVIMQNNLQLAGQIEGVDGGNYNNDFKTGGNVIAGVGEADQVGLRTHVHSGVQIGGGTTTPPTPGT